MALLGLVLTYALGFSAGVARTEARLAEEGDHRLAAPGPVVDPLRPGRPDVNPRGAGAARDVGAGTDATSSQHALHSSSQPPARADGRAGDPRVSGQYYFVLAHASVEKARNEMVEFLRANGLEPHVVRDHNGVLRKVILLPGFPTKDASSSPGLRQMRERIREVGLKWARQGRGNRDFGDAYLEIFRQ